MAKKTKAAEEILNTSSGLQDTASDKVFYIINRILLAFFMLLVLIPLLNIVACSFSSGKDVVAGRVFIWPVNFSLEGYTAVFNHKRIWTAYGNTILYTVVGTLINLVMTVLAAYPLSRRGVPGNKFVTFLFTFTMIFSGGMVPTYLQVKDLRMLNTIWAMVLPGAISVTNMIICRTFFANIPYDLHEAAEIDGCNDFTYLRVIVLPLSSSVLAVLTLYYSVGHWNTYQDAFLYLTGMEKMPLQILLRDILVSNQMLADMLVDDSEMVLQLQLAELLKYSIIIVASVPVLVLYPFVKRFFAKGVMLGSLKG